MFEQRIDTSEFIDRPDCDPQTIRRSHAFMRRVNRFFGGTAAVRQFVLAVAARPPAARPLKILDIGSGSGDIPRSILRWAAGKNIDVQFTCVEKEAAAVPCVPNSRDASNPALRFVNEDIFRYHPEGEFDYAAASMFLHHLTAEQIAALLAHLRPFVRNGIFINDLHRTALTYFSCLCISPFMPSDVRHDALISIRKGFQKQDLQGLLKMPKTVLTVKTRPWGRITALLEWKGTPR